MQSQTDILFHCLSSNGILLLVGVLVVTENEKITTFAVERVRCSLTRLNCFSAPSVMDYVVWCFFLLFHLFWPPSLTPRTFLWLERMVQSSLSDAQLPQPPFQEHPHPPIPSQQQHPPATGEVGWISWKKAAFLKLIIVYLEQAVSTLGPLFITVHW